MKPIDVVSPKGRWRTIEILIDGTDMGDGHSLALGLWDGHAALGMRWDGATAKDVGSPQSRGLGTWFIVPADYEDGILGCIPSSEKTKRAKILLDSKRAQR